VKLRWDDEFLYVAAYLQETQVWANITKGPDVIFHDNDFEVPTALISSQFSIKTKNMCARNSALNRGRRSPPQENPHDSHVHLARSLWILRAQITTTRSMRSTQTAQIGHVR
jgi:hypothetical protein